MANTYRLDRSTAILPTGTNVNLYSPAENPYWDGEHMCYHVFRGTTASGRPSYRVVGGAHSAGQEPYWPIGTKILFHHDQTFRDFGELTLVGRWHESTIEGDVPDRKIPLSVLK